MNFDPVLAAVDTDFEAHLSRLQRHIRQPSISATGEGIAEMTSLLAADIGDLGGVAEVIESVDFPVVVGRFDAGAERTVLIHGTYDTTPANPAEWVSPPFDAAIMQLPGLGDCVVGRGAEDAKSAFAATLSMVAAHRVAGVELPVNLVLLQEASELGSKSLPDFVLRNREALSDVDVAYWPWLTQRPDGTAVAWLGVKGLMTLKLRVRGGDWGGPVGSGVHGLHSIWVANPVHRLAAALASLKSSDDGTILVDGFFDPVRPPSEAEERLVAALASRVDEAALLGEAHARRFKQSSLLEALWAYCFSTEINVSGINGGLVIEGGHKVELPAEAVASLDIRPLDGMTVDHIVTSLRNHLDRKGFGEVQIEVLNGYAGGSMPSDAPAVEKLLETYRAMGHDPEVWPRTSTAIASHLFIEELGVPWIATCPGTSGNKHAPDEFVSVAGYREAISFMTRLMWRLAG